MYRKRLFLFVFICLVLGLNHLYAENQKWITVNQLCKMKNYSAKMNLKLGYVDIANGKRKARVFVGLPYIVSGRDVYYFNKKPARTRKGAVALSTEQAVRVIEILSRKDDKTQDIIDKKVVVKPDETKKDKKEVDVDGKFMSDKEIERIISLDVTNDKKEVSDSKTSITERDKTKKEVYNTNIAFQPINAIIIDAGHGGKDPGALGKTGTKEKQIVLNIAKLVAGYLKSGKVGKVFLTRSGDYFVTLENRTRLSSQWARTYNPVFVSIHANYSLSRKSVGIEVYSLSDRASDDEASRAELLENAGFSTTDIKNTEVLYSIIADLVRDGVRDDSERMASNVYDMMAKTMKAPKRGLKKARFYVLKYNPVPAVLVEVGFLSHKKEEKRLKEKNYQQKTAKGIYLGIKKYIEEYNKTRGFVK